MPGISYTCDLPKEIKVYPGWYIYGWLLQGATNFIFDIYSSRIKYNGYVCDGKIVHNMKGVL